MKSKYSYKDITINNLKSSDTADFFNTLDFVFKIGSAEDLNLLSYYNGNRLIETEDSIDDSIKNQIYNLFRLTGYSCDYYGVPNVNSRVYYNFLKCSPEFEEFNWNYGKDILDDIKTKYEIGVTYFHRVNGTYDWSQEKENFESWMINS